MKFWTVALLTVLPVEAASEWIRLRSPNFELYTTAGERKAKEAILYFEQMRTLFLSLSSGRQFTAQPVRIIAFRGDKEYAPYRPNEFAAAFYQAGNERDHIVMGTLAGEFYPTALHEYTHLITKHSGAKFPIWLNEGLAELYASTKPIGNKVQIGNVIPGRVFVLQQSKFVPLEALFGTTHGSPMYNEKDKAGIFYAQSWLLTHMVFFSPEYRPKVPQFLQLAASGADSAEAFQKVYGKPTKDVDKDLKAYLRADSIFVVNIDAKLDKSAEEPAVDTPDAVEVNLVLAELLSNMPGKKAAAEAMFRELESPGAGNPRVLAARGWFHLRNGERDQATEFFRKAVEQGSRSATLHHDLALLLWSGPGSDSKKVVELLRKAVELDPTIKDGYWDLAMAALNAREFGAAAAALSRLKTVTPERAFRYYYSAAFCNYELGAYPASRDMAAKARPYAADAAETSSLDRLLQAVEYKEHAPKAVAFVPEVAVPLAAPAADSESDRPVLKRREQAEVIVETQTATFPSIEGSLRQVDCLGAEARLQVDAGGQRVAFLIRDPGAVVIRNLGQGTHEFTCGPQKGQPVKVEFTQDKSLPAGITGAVRAIEFQ